MILLKMVTEMRTFKVGDQVVFIRDNREGGSSVGAKGDEATVIEYHNNTSGYYARILRVRMKSGRTKGASWWCHEDDIRVSELTYDPNQQGDTDEDI